MDTDIETPNNRRVTPNLIFKKESIKDNMKSPAVGTGTDEEDIDDDTFCKRWRRRNCNLQQFLQMIAVSIIIAMIWFISFAIFGDDCGPTSEFTQLLVLFCSAKLLGMMMELIYVPSIMGMIIMGAILRNVNYINFSKEYMEVCSLLRKCSLLSILLPAAFSLDPAVLRRLGWMLMVVSFFPMLIEVLVNCVLAYFTLSLPWLWAIMLGFIMAASAPAIVIPCLFALEDLGYGNGEGIHTIASASCIVITIECIVFFGLLFGFVTNKGSLLEEIGEGPMEIGIGLAYGLVLGLVFWVIPSDVDWYATTLRTLLIGGGTLVALFGGMVLNFNFASVIATFTLAFFANLRWRCLGWGRYNPVRDNYKLVWRFFEPVAFSLIGMEMDFAKLKMFDVIVGSVIMLFATLVRFLFTIVLIYRFGFSMKNTIFLSLTYISKATVQAAIGPLAMDWARSLEEDETTMEYAGCVLTLTVMSIVLTSPLGVALLLTLGPRLLTFTDEPGDSLRRVGVSFSRKPDVKVRQMSRQLATNLLNTKH